MSKPKFDSIIVEGVEYVPKSLVKEKSDDLDGMPYKIVRTQGAGVFAGYVEKKEGQGVVLRNARRLWYWDGAASLSQLAMEGVKKPENCKFPCEVDRVELEQVIETLDVTKQAQESINNVKIWSM